MRGTGVQAEVYWCPGVKNEELEMTCHSTPVTTTRTTTVTTTTTEYPSCSTVQGDNLTICELDILMKSRAQ